MTLSAKMLAVLQKVDAARAKLFAGLRASTERGAEQEHALKAARKRPPPTIIRRGDAQTGHVLSPTCLHSRARWRPDLFGADDSGRHHHLGRDAQKSQNHQDQK